METGLWKQFDRIVVFDTETTGIEFGRDEIIELGAAAFSAEGETDCMDLECPYHYPEMIQQRMAEDELPELLTLEDLVEVEETAEETESTEATDTTITESETTKTATETN